MRTLATLIILAAILTTTNVDALADAFLTTASSSSTSLLTIRLGAPSTYPTFTDFALKRRYTVCRPSSTTATTATLDALCKLMGYQKWSTVYNDGFSTTMTMSNTGTIYNLNCPKGKSTQSLSECTYTTDKANATGLTSTQLNNCANQKSQLELRCSSGDSNLMVVDAKSLQLLVRSAYSSTSMWQGVCDSTVAATGFAQSLTANALCKLSAGTTQAAGSALFRLSSGGSGGGSNSNNASKFTLRLGGLVCTGGATSTTTLNSCSYTSSSSSSLKCSYPSQAVGLFCSAASLPPTLAPATPPPPTFAPPGTPPAASGGVSVGDGLFMKLDNDGTGRVLVRRTNDTRWSKVCYQSSMSKMYAAQPLCNLITGSTANSGASFFPAEGGEIDSQFLLKSVYCSAGSSASSLSQCTLGYTSGDACGSGSGSGSGNDNANPQPLGLRCTAGMPTVRAGSYDFKMRASDGALLAKSRYSSQYGYVCATTTDTKALTNLARSMCSLIFGMAGEGSTYTTTYKSYYSSSDGMYYKMRMSICPASATSFSSCSYYTSSLYSCSRYLTLKCAPTKTVQTNGFAFRFSPAPATSSVLLAWQLPASATSTTTATASSYRDVCARYFSTSSAEAVCAIMTGDGRGATYTTTSRLSGSYALQIGSCTSESSSSTSIASLNKCSYGTSTSVCRSYDALKLFCASPDWSAPVLSGKYYLRRNLKTLQLQARSASSSSAFWGAVVASSTSSKYLGSLTANKMCSFLKAGTFGRLSRMSATGQTPVLDRVACYSNDFRISECSYRSSSISSSYASKYALKLECQASAFAAAESEGALPKGVSIALIAGGSAFGLFILVSVCTSMLKAKNNNAAASSASSSSAASAAKFGRGGGDHFSSSHATGPTERNRDMPGHFTTNYASNPLTENNRDMPSHFESSQVEYSASSQSLNFQRNAGGGGGGRRRAAGASFAYQQHQPPPMMMMSPLPQFGAFSPHHEMEMSNFAHGVPPQNNNNSAHSATSSMMAGFVTPKADVNFY